MRAEIGFTLGAADFGKDGTLNMAHVAEILSACAGLIGRAAPVPAGGQFASDITDSRGGCIGRVEIGCPPVDLG